MGKEQENKQETQIKEWIEERKAQKTIKNNKKEQKIPVGIATTATATTTTTTKKKLEPKQTKQKPIKAELWFVRHGETSWNVRGVLQGQTDTYLTEKGETQANALGNYLYKNFIKRDPKTYHATIYSSDLNRAATTAKLMMSGFGEQQPNYQLVKDARLREINFGKYQGTKVLEFRRKMKAGFYEPVDSDYGESWAQVMQRVEDAVADIVEAHEQNCKIIIVSHGGVISNFTRYMLNLEQKRVQGFKTTNSSISRFAIAYYPSKRGKEKCFQLKQIKWYNFDGHLIEDNLMTPRVIV